jgi:hypothetical protein
MNSLKIQWNLVQYNQWIHSKSNGILFNTINEFTQNSVESCSIQSMNSLKIQWNHLKNKRHISCSNGAWPFHSCTLRCSSLGIINSIITNRTQSKCPPKSMILIHNDCKEGRGGISHTKDRQVLTLVRKWGFQSNNCLTVYQNKLQSTTTEMQFQFQFQYQYQYTTTCYITGQISVYSWTHCSKRP